MPRGLPASCTRASWSAAQDAVPPEVGPQLALAPLPGPLPRSSLRTSSLRNAPWCSGAAPRAPSEPATPAAPLSPLLAAASRECLPAAPRLCACPSAGRCAALHSASEVPSRAAGPHAGSVSGRRPGALAVASPASASSSSASLSLPVLTDSTGLPKWCSSALPLPIVHGHRSGVPQLAIYCRVIHSNVWIDVRRLPLWQWTSGTCPSLNVHISIFGEYITALLRKAHAGPGAARLLGRLGLCEVPGASASEPDSDSDGGRSMAAM